LAKRNVDKFALGHRVYQKKTSPSPAAKPAMGSFDTCCQLRPGRNPSIVKCTLAEVLAHFQAFCRNSMGGRSIRSLGNELRIAENARAQMILSGAAELWRVQLRTGNELLELLDGAR
jgi:hypothetical protein